MGYEKWREFFRSFFGRKKPSFWRQWWEIFKQSGQGFWKNQCTLYVSSLTFYTLMSIVPLFAIAFAIAGGLGFYNYLESDVLQRFQGQKEVLTEIIHFAKKMIEQARGGPLAAIGSLLFLWSIGTLFRSMEDAFNQIWKVKSRTWKRVLSDYSALIILGPLLFLLSSSATIFVTTQLEGWVQILPIDAIGLLFVIHLIPYAIFWILFTSIFLFVPHTRVRFSAAAISGIFTAIFYLIVQEGYIYFQQSISRYDAIYGSFAALPLFLIWLQLSWSILLFGGELAYAYQNRGKNG